MKHRIGALMLAELTGDRGRRRLRRVPSAPAGRPAVTVIVLSHNYGRYLGPCARSVLDQRDVDVELVIVDDASTDDTAAVAARIAGGDRRVTIVRNPVNRGQLPSMNAALDRVTTDYVVKLDADDLLAPGSLARSAALLEAWPEVTFVYGRPQHFTGPVPRPRDEPARSWTVWDGRAWLARRCRSGANVISQPEVLMRTTAVHQVGPVREDLPHTFDLHLWLRLAALGDVGRVNGPAQGYYRVHDQSLQRTAHAGALFDLRGRRAAFDAAFGDGEAGVLADAGDLHRRARRALAASALDRACRAYDRRRTGTEPVTELVDFALDTCPSARDLPEWRALARRQAAGARAAPRRPRFIADTVARRAGEVADGWWWQWTGER